MAVDPYAFAPEVKPAVDEINRRFPALGRGGTYPEHGDDQPGGLEENFYSADFWSTVKADHDEAFAWIIANAERLNLKYVISWCRIWSVERASEGIRRYFQCAKPGTSASQRHTNHVHTSFNEEGFYMPSLSDIRKVVREEVAKVWDLDVIPVAGNPANPTWKAKSALAEVVKNTKPQG